MGMNYFSANDTIDDERDVTDVSYGYDGTLIGLHFAFLSHSLKIPDFEYVFMDVHDCPV